MLDIKKIKKIQREKNITNQQLADDAGVTSAMMTYILQGKRRPNIDTVVFMSKTLGCTVDQIVRG